MTDKEIQQLEDKKFLANSKDRSKNTAEISKKLEELKPLPFPEIPAFPEKIVVELAGVEMIKGDKGEKGELGERGEPGQDGKDGLDGQDGLNGTHGKDGTNGKDGVDGKDGMDGQAGKDGSPDSPQQIAKKLQSLKNAWLEVKAIKGFEDYMREFGSDFLNQAKSFAPRALSALYDVDMTNVSDQQGVIWDATKRKFVPGSPAGSGTGFTKLPATGTVDGSNTSFTFTTKPTYAVLDGAWYTENNGWTWNSGTLTMTTTVPPQTSIWGFV